MDDTETSHKIFVVVIAVIIIAGFLYLGLNKKNPAQNISDSYFSNESGGYSFDVPVGWNAVISSANVSNTLFGENATGEMGQGGVEVFPNVKASDFLSPGFSQAEYGSQNPIIVSGVEGVETDYKGIVGIGHAVVIEKGGTVYNIYINSDSEPDVQNLYKLVASFKFTK